jgi:fatty-acyl-CoA synthase
MVDTDINLEVRELETLIGQLDEVIDVVVISIDQGEDSFILKAFVETENNKTILNEKAIIDYCLENARGKNIPSSVIFCQIPRTPSGKVARMILLEQIVE